LFLLDHGQVHASTRSAHGAREVAGELLLQLVPLVDRVLVQRLEPCKLRSRGEKAGKPSPSAAVDDFFCRSSSILWRAS
jgi:hypothetical protein